MVFPLKSAIKRSSPRISLLPFPGAKRILLGSLRNMARNVLFTAALTVILAGVAMSRSPIPDILLDKEDIGNEVPTNTIGRLLNGPSDTTNDVPCQIDVRYTKKIIGKCVKLGPGTDGCVAGSYLHPFHQDCMLSR